MRIEFQYFNAKNQAKNKAMNKDKKINAVYEQSKRANALTKHSSSHMPHVSCPSALMHSRISVSPETGSYSV